MYLTVQTTHQSIGVVMPKTGQDGQERQGAVLLHFVLGFNKVGERDRKKILTPQGEFLEPLIGGQWNRKQKSVKPNFFIASRGKERQLLGEKKQH